MSDWYDSLETIDQTTVETFGPTYPYCQWVHGDAKLKQLGVNSVAYAGGWFIPRNMAVSAPQGWTAMTLEHRNNTSTDGYGCRDIEVAVLASRFRWLANVKGQMLRFPWKQYDQALQASDMHKATGHTQVAVVIRGMEDSGVYVLTMRGMTGKAWKDITIQFSERVVRTANELARSKGKKGRFPFRAFWLKVGSKRNADGSPIFEKVGKEATVLITPPTLIGVSEKPDHAELGRLFVGEANLRRFNELWTEAQSWAKDAAFDGSQGDAGLVAETTAAEDDENVPF